jgi:hypothetical protein
MTVLAEVLYVSCTVCTFIFLTKREALFQAPLKIGSPGKTRTCNLLVNSQTLLPIELPGNTYIHNIKEPVNLPASAELLLPIELPRNGLLINNKSALYVKGSNL